MSLSTHFFSYGSASGGGGGAASPFPTINADGFTALYTATPPTFDPNGSPVSAPVTRQGYDSTGASTTFLENLIVTQRVRQVYPNQASLTALTVALSDYWLTTDNYASVTNNSTEAGPAPIANWAMLGRQTVGNSITLEVTGNHWFARSGKPFACVEFSVTDGTNTVTAKVSSMTVSGHASDRFAVLVYSATLDITSLTSGLVTANAKVYPHVGSAVNDSSLNSGGREFSPRHFLKSTSKTSSPPYAYVASTGNNGTGVVSTTAAVAKVAPFLTIQGAIDGLIAASGTTGGVVDGCIIRVTDSISVGSSAAVAKAQNVSCVIVERDPDVAKSAAVVTLGATWRARLGVGTLTAPLTEGAILFRDLTFVRGGTFTFTGEAANQLNVMFSGDVAFDNGSFNSTLMSNSHLWWEGATVTNSAASLFNPATYETRMIRGVSVSNGNNTVEGFLVLGCHITASGALSTGTRSESNSIVQFNRFTNPASTVAVWNMGQTNDVSHASFSQNLVEVCHTTSATPGIRVTSDSAAGDAYHVLVDNNTFTGYGTAGRFNAFYDEGATARTSRFCRARNNILANLYTKGDVFVTNGARVGNWVFLYGSGSHRNFTQFVNPGVNSVGTTEGQAFSGLGADIGTSITVRNDPVFADYQGSTAVAGTSGGTYTLQAGSPCIGMVPAAEEIFPLDIAGNTRDRGSTGAYR